MNTDLTEYLFIFSLLQPTVADVLHCVFHWGKDLNEPDRRQVGADPLKTDFNPLLFYHPAERNECHTRFGHRSHTVMIPLNVYDQEEIPDRYFPPLWFAYSVVGLDKYFMVWFLTHCGQLMCLIFPQLSVSAATNSFHCFTASLISHSKKGLISCLSACFSSQHTPILFQFIHLLRIAGIFCKCCPYGNYYFVATPHSVWL